MDGADELDFRDVELIGRLDQDVTGNALVTQPLSEFFRNFFPSAVRTS
jgi:hypothetical protein